MTPIAVISSQLTASIAWSLRKWNSGPNRYHSPQNRDRLCILIAGEQDPLHDALKRLQTVMQAFNDGQWQLSADVYPAGRHEMFHAPERDAVIDKLLDVLKGWD